MNQKKFIDAVLLVLIVVLAGMAGYAVLKKETAPAPAPSPSSDGLPEWVKKIISEKESSPVENPPALIVRCESAETFVYYLPAPCCDQLSTLYNAAGDVICSPDGGITGEGDGRCPNFDRSKLNCESVWQDTRTTKQIFSSQETCERTTGKDCTYTMCDYAPPGKTIEEVCGPGPSKGWTPIQ